MHHSGKITIRGIVQGVGFRPFVYSEAVRRGMHGWVKNLGSEVEIVAEGDRFDDFVAAVSRGTPLSRIDSVEIGPAPLVDGSGFVILESGDGRRSGFIPADVAICDDCVEDLFTPGGRYEGYWATSCVNCGPRYSIIREIPYDRDRTTMDAFPPCPACRAEYGDPGNRRHHAQTIACHRCGPALSLVDTAGTPVPGDPVREAARLLDQGAVVAIRGIGGFHIACIESTAEELKSRLGRSEQPLAVMVRPDAVDGIARLSLAEREMLESPARPIVVLEKWDHRAHTGISPLHTIGCMLPYTGLHHLLFDALDAPLLVMTSANMPGDPMITGIDQAMASLSRQADYFLTHDRAIQNRVDDSVIRDGYIIRLSRGLAPMRTAIDLGRQTILGVGPEMNANVTCYQHGFAITSPHVGHVRNPATLAYLEETVERISTLIGASPDLIAHDLHPQFLSTRLAHELAEVHGARTVAVQHHRAHIAAVTDAECVGIAIDGVGYGDDGHIWGGEIFAGAVPDLERICHLEYVPMPGGDRATVYPERMLYGLAPTQTVQDILSSRGWSEIELGVLARQLERGVGVARTSSTGRVLDAAAALLGICRERTFDGEPAMRLESWAASGTPREWEIPVGRSGGCRTLSTTGLIDRTLSGYLALADLPHGEREQEIRDLAASVQYNLARSIAGLAVETAEERGIRTVALSGGVAYNRAIRETIRAEVERAGLVLLCNSNRPLGDGCISFGQCVYAARTEEG
ncbi:MAG: carbamoyltransferase HypF [Methanomicrobiales archaeon]